MARRGWLAWGMGLLGLIFGLGMGIQWAGRGYPADHWWPAPAVVKQVAPSVVLVKNFSAHKLQGIGSGVVIDSKGNIVTNYHVVERATRIQVVVGDRSLAGQIVGVDPPTDLAVVRIHARAPLPEVDFARSSHIEPGQLVVAIGNSLGLSQTVTVGVISAKDRVITRDGQEYHLIQTDAAINPGNSGGPLLNSHGRLIGINSSKISQAGIEGIGFAIPSDVVRNVVSQILHYGTVRRPWLGITVASGPPGAVGLFVVAVSGQGPAARAGLQAGDFLTMINGKRLHTAAQLGRILAKSPIGGRLVMMVMRGSNLLTLTARLEAAPTSMESPPTADSRARLAKSGLR